MPINYNSGELIASRGVRAMFYDENVDAVEAGERIRCERQRRVGTHMVSTVCMTLDEWKQRQRRTRELAEDRLNQPCIASPTPRSRFTDPVQSCGEYSSGL